MPELNEHNKVRLIDEGDIAVLTHIDILEIMGEDADPDILPGGETPGIVNKKLTMKIEKILPEAPFLDPNTIYLVPKTTADGESNIYDEYIVVVEGEGSSEVKRAERIGDTTIDLSEYVKNEDIVAITDEEIRALIAEVDSE